MAERLPGVREPLPLTLAVPRGRAVIRQGDSGSGLWVVESGALVATIVAPDGHMLALDVLGTGDAVGEPAGQESAATVRALRLSRLRPVDPVDVPMLLAARAARAAAMALDLAWMDVPSRVRHRLDDLATRFGLALETGTRIGLSLTQEDLAALTGTSRESVNRALRAMERADRLAIEGRGRYVVPRRPGASVPITEAGLRPPPGGSSGCRSSSSGRGPSLDGRSGHTPAAGSAARPPRPPCPDRATRPSASSFNRWASTERAARGCTSGGCAA